MEEVKEANEKLNEDIKEECSLGEDNSIIKDFLQNFQFKLWLLQIADWFL